MKLNRIEIDTSNSITDLCRLGQKYPTDKSPYNKDDSLHKHPYTAIYDLLFSQIRYNRIFLAEIGILNNNSMKCWREYFPNANLYGYEWNDDFLKKAITDGLHNTEYRKMNVKDVKSIRQEMIGEIFDIIIDDSTHEFSDQINIINNVYECLPLGGMLIIEDIFTNANEEHYEREISSHYSSGTFIVANHKLKHSPGWNNDKLLVLFR